MKKLLAPLVLAVCASFGASAATLNLSTVTTNTTIANNTTVTGTLNSNVKLTIAHGATITLSDATINGDEVNSSSYKWAGLTCDGNATVILVGENFVNSFYDGYPGIYVPELRTLTIQGSGSLNAIGCTKAAGIGGGLGQSLNYLGNCGTIVINGGEITAEGGYGGAGIGGGQSSICTSIVINGGKISVSSGIGGAGIGSGYGGSCGSIAIKGGRIEALGYSNGGVGGAGIGSGVGGKCGVVMFGDGNFAVMAATEDSSPIGAGYRGSCDAVVDKEAIVEMGFYSPYTVCSLIPKTLNLANVTESIDVHDGQVITGTLAANVKVYIDDGATVTLRDATINGMGSGAGITCDGDATIILEGANTVRANVTIPGFPGIYVPEGNTLTIGGDGSLTAYGNMYGAGIGGGISGACGNIVIESGTVEAAGGFGAAGIGGGFNNDCGDITITKGVTSVTATMGVNSADSIGASYEGSCGTVTIGGVVGEITESPYTYRGAGAALPAPAFAAGGKAATTEFTQGANGKWTLTTFAEMSNDALGSDVANSQIKVYSASTVEGLNSASPMSSGVTVKGKKSAVMTTIEVTPPGNPPRQFFKVKFGE